MANKEARYVKTTLSKGEKILEIFQEHWVTRINYWLNYSLAVVGLLLAVGPNFLPEYFDMGWLSFWIPLWIGLFFGSWGACLNVEFYFKEVVLTNKRVIFKRGIIGVTTQEQLLSKTDTVVMNQSFDGRIFGYADIKLTMTGSSDLLLKELADARRVKARIEEAL